MGNGMIDSMIEPHLRDTVGATQTEIGVTFMIDGIVYTLSGIGAGYVYFLINYADFNWKCCRGFVIVQYLTTLM